MKKIWVIILFILTIFCLPHIAAEDVEFSVDQTEYYFLTGQQAIIPLTMNNTFEKQINGRLTYKLTQTVNQGGKTFSSTNSQSQSFSVPEGNNTIQINFGKSDQPLKVEADLEFSFKDNDEDYLVSLEDILIYFVSNQSQKNNQQNTKKSNSEKITNAEPSSNNQNQPQTPQEKLQNNQMNQDSQALKKQIQKQMTEKQTRTDEFEQSLFNNSDFQKQHQSLQDHGYNLTNKKMNAESKDTGTFNFTYENDQGEQASFKGKMKNGELTDYQKQTAEDRKKLFETLNQSKKYQDLHKKLTEQGYNQTSISYDQRGNKTIMNISYENDENKTALITAEFYDEKLQEVKLFKQKDISLFLWIFPVILIIVFVGIYLYYRYFKQNNKIDSFQRQVTKPFNYKKEAARLLSEAERLYQLGKYKEAYGKAGQSLRLYLSYKHGLRKEITNSDILNFLKNKQHPYQEIKHCFCICSLVEFAKFKTNESDFKRIYSTVRSIIAG